MKPQMTSSQAAHASGMPEGPLNSIADAGQLFSSLGLGNGAYEDFPPYFGAKAFMLKQPPGTRFGLIYYNAGAPMAHAVAGQRTRFGLVFRDYQDSVLQWFRPQGATETADFWIFTF